MKESADRRSPWPRSRDALPVDPLDDLLDLGLLDRDVGDVEPVHDLLDGRRRGRSSRRSTSRRNSGAARSRAPGGPLKTRCAGIRRPLDVEDDRRDRKDAVAKRGERSVEEEAPVVDDDDARQSVSMSARSCVVRSTVVPSTRLISWRNSRTFAFATTSSPIVGSSRKSSGGRWSSDAARSQRMRSPSDSLRTGWWRYALRSRAPCRRAPSARGTPRR